MKAKKKDTEPPVKSATTASSKKSFYDYRAGTYPVQALPGGRIKSSVLDAESAPKESSRLNFDERLVDAAYDVSSSLVKNPFLFESKFNQVLKTYADKSRKLIGRKIAKRMGGNLDTSPSLQMTSGEQTFISNVDNVVDKLSGLSDSDIDKLKNEIIRLSRDYRNIDPTASAASRLASATSIASGQDWSRIKPIRERAGLSKEDITSLIQAPSDSPWYEQAAYSAARAAINLKDFRSGGKIKKR